MSKYIKNNTQSNITIQGREIQANSVYTIPSNLENEFANDDELLSKIISGDVCISSNGSTCLLNNNEQINFLKSLDIQPKDVNGYPLIKLSAFANNDGYRARFKGIKSTVTAGQTINIEHKITEERWINGVRLILKNHSEDDYIDFEIVDVDNIFGYGAGTVLDRFGEDWQIDDTRSLQGDVIVPYPAKLYTNLYIRIKYHSTGQTDVKVKANFYLHKKG